MWNMNYDVVFIFNDIWEVKDWRSALTQQLSGRVSLRLFTRSFSRLHEAEDRGGLQVTSSPADNKLWYWFILPDDSPTNLSSKCVQNHTEILKNNKTDCHLFVFFDCFLVKTSSRGNKQAKCCNVLNSSTLRTARVIITTLDYWFIKHFPKVLHKGSNSKTFKSYNHLVLKKNLVTTGNRYKKTN